MDEKVIFLRILDTMNRKKIKQIDLAKAVGVSKNTVTQWKVGKSFSYMKMIKQISDHLGVTVDYLLTGEKIDSTPHPTADKRYKKIPLLGEIACGLPILAVDNIEEMIIPPYGVECDYALTCRGDSMIDARIFNGDTVYIKECQQVEDGDIAAICIGNEATLKKVHYYEDKVVLSPCNPLYRDLVFTKADDAHIIGKAVAFTSAVRK